MRKLLYRDADGRQIALEVPWEDGSGNIPPPIVTFHSDGVPVPFAYVDSAPSRQEVMLCWRREDADGPVRLFHAVDPIELEQANGATPWSLTAAIKKLEQRPGEGWGVTLVSVDHDLEAIVPLDRDV